LQSRQARIDIVYFPEGVAGNRIEEKIFQGPLDQQLRDALTHLKNMFFQERVTKVSDRAEAIRVFNYSYPALDEALVNAAYHRSYELREPIEVDPLRAVGRRRRRGSVARRGQLRSLTKTASSFRRCTMQFSLDAYLLGPYDLVRGRKLSSR
jgi:hypothetical protein